MELKELRVSRGFNQLDLELVTGISQSKISIFERGYRKPTFREKEKLAKALGVETNALIFKMRSVRHGCTDS